MGIALINPGHTKSFTQLPSHGEYSSKCEAGTKDQMLTASRARRCSRTLMGLLQNDCRACSRCPNVLSRILAGGERLRWNVILQLWSYGERCSEKWIHPSQLDNNKARAGAILIRSRLLRKLWLSRWRASQSELERQETGTQKMAAHQMSQVAGKVTEACQRIYATARCLLSIIVNFVYAH